MLFNKKIKVGKILNERKWQIGIEKEKCLLIIEIEMKSNDNIL